MGGKRAQKVTVHHIACRSRHAISVDCHAESTQDAEGLGASSISEAVLHKMAQCRSDSPIEQTRRVTLAALPSRCRSSIGEARGLIVQRADILRRQSLPNVLHDYANNQSVTSQSSKKKQQGPAMLMHDHTSCRQSTSPACVQTDDSLTTEADQFIIGKDSRDIVLADTIIPDGTKSAQGAVGPSTPNMRKQPILQHRSTEGSIYQGICSAQVPKRHQEGQSSSVAALQGYHRPKSTSVRACANTAGVHTMFGPLRAGMKQSSISIKLSHSESQAHLKSPAATVRSSAPEPAESPHGPKLHGGTHMPVCSRDTQNLLETCQFTSQPSQRSVSTVVLL